MKAKHYYAKLLACKSEEEIEKCIEQTLLDFVKDAEELIRIRCAKTRAAIISCIQDVNQKWKALVRIVEEGKASIDDNDEEKFFLKFLTLRDEGFQASFVHLHPEYSYAFDMKSFEKKIEDETKRQNEALKLFMPHEVKPFEELTKENMIPEYLACLAALGSYYRIGMPIGWMKPLIARIDLLKKWIDNGYVIDQTDIDEYNNKFQ